MTKSTLLILALLKGVLKTPITASRKLVISAESRKEMEDWINVIRAAKKEPREAVYDPINITNGQHKWHACSHNRPTFCNVCRESFSGVKSHGLSCEVCKYKAHKRCAARAPNNCKWTTSASIDKECLISNDKYAVPHQWNEGNLASGSKCGLCERSCGSTKRLQDFRCLWCGVSVHKDCKPLYPAKCSLGPHRVSTIPPIAINVTTAFRSVVWEAKQPPNCSPLLVFINSKSGENQGVRFIRRFKQLLNPTQVYDLMVGGPSVGLSLFRNFNPFRVLICGGDGSIGWVLSEVDKMNLSHQCQVGVLPLGTGNDLARVLGWGSACDDESHVPTVLAQLEKSSTKMLDRWGIMTRTNDEENAADNSKITIYESSVASHLAKMIESTDNTEVIRSTRVFCETVKQLIDKVKAAFTSTSDPTEPDSIIYKCSVLNEKVTLLLRTLSAETEAASSSFNASTHADDQISLRYKEALKSRANSLKKAIRQIIEHAEKALDEQNRPIISQNLDSLRSISSISDVPLDVQRDMHCTESKNNQQMSTNYESRPRKGSEPAPMYKDNNMATKPSFKQSMPNLSAPKIVFPNDEDKAKINAHLINPILAKATSEKSLNGYKERCIMNNYFGIGLDAKISLDFHLRREEHPDKYRNRARNKMCYLLMGGREIINNTFRNLYRRLIIECDGKELKLPRLQGIVVLNIPSYMGGTNFWGSTREEAGFVAPSYDDKLLEVVAVSGASHFARTKVFGIQQDRLTQCRSLKITILGNEDIPIQVDGEAWMQKPGVIQIVHKNRMPMLVRNQAFESALRSWNDKTKARYIPRLTAEEENALAGLEQASSKLIQSIEMVAESEAYIETDLYQLASNTASALDKLFPNGRLPEISDSTFVFDMIELIQTNIANNRWFMNMQSSNLSTKLCSEQESNLAISLATVERETKIITERFSRKETKVKSKHSQKKSIKSSQQSSQTTSSNGLLAPQSHPDHAPIKATSIRDLQGLIILDYDINSWGTDKVADWVDQIGLPEYTQSFQDHDICGRDLLTLDRNDLTLLGVTKVGHVKRILRGIQGLQEKMGEQTFSMDNSDRKMSAHSI
ncbi:uncharacterized protein TRIADDRAFT_52046 [Trichoplax adhaerens]|uniref:Diacylglycerol kinase n=1 Tax=Trichoplax adhaerens TaxID=10228 RepID=B3RLL6_TRIAD|nr:hypothetical protein TRIADDRAFT_52046 [Trichoplax adhaerens]EDV28803.1 hypothetical protein TRIADDRAFT_52046 [Trichoplax adhaerens]|eukprot:XP_002108005.1 hypothetical protein TRIADDRAFT_52046 [Trichoplax adhaerens]